LYIGYRYYTTANVKVAYPFGFGLSYTTFEYSDISADEKGVSFTIKNTGKVDGAEVAQLYVGMNGGKIFRPALQLKGFKKVFVKAGESVKVTIPFDDKTFRYFNVSTNKWEVEGGTYQLYVGASSTDIKLDTTIERAGTTDVVPYNPEELPSYYSGKVSNVGEDEFKALLKRDIPKSGYNFYKRNRMVIDENCTVADLRYSKRWVGRAFSGVIRFAIAACKAFGMRTLANTLVMGVLHQPVRGIAKFGGMNRRQMEALLLMFNGHFFKGVGHFLTKEKKKA
jgi:beta-glucosidase